MGRKSVVESVASAPGKVLLAGGYLVLDRYYTGLVFGLSARIHSCVRPATRPNETGSQHGSPQTIVVTSPQFRNAQWSYEISLAGDTGVKAKQIPDEINTTANRNPFVETTLIYVLSYIAQTLVLQKALPSCAITILADTSYYTKPSGTSITTTAPREAPFVDFGVELSQAHKTGLGSSAALVTSLTAALLHFYLTNSRDQLSSDEGKATLHNLAQAAHCAAQGKIGSGFDVASAVYGSCLYRRFSPSLLEKLGSPGSADFASRLKHLVDQIDDDNRWDTEIQKDRVKMPGGLRLIMCDVDCGSETPGMVKQVLSWRTREPEEADMLWTHLQRKNEALANALTAASQSGLDPGSDAIRKAIQDIRTSVRDMSRLSGVPIEPSSQTDLLDACSNVDGVLGGVVPGAGGFDAVALLVKDSEETMSKLSDVLQKYQIPSASVDAAAGEAEPSIGRVSILDVREEMEGVRWEGKSPKYKGWLCSSKIRPD